MKLAALIDGARSPSRRTIAPRRPSSRHESVALSARARRAARLRLATRRSGRRRPRPRSRASRRPGSARGPRRHARSPGRRVPRTTMNQVGSARTLRYSSAVASTLTRQFWSLHSQTISIRSPFGNDSPSSRIRSFTDRKSASFFAARTCERGIARDYRDGAARSDVGRDRVRVADQRRPLERLAPARQGVGDAGRTGACRGLSCELNLARPAGPAGKVVSIRQQGCAPRSRISARGGPAPGRVAP